VARFAYADLRTQICVLNVFVCKFMIKTDFGQIAYADLRTQIYVRDAFYAYAAGLWPDLRTQICVCKSVYSMYLFANLREKLVCGQIAYTDLCTQICVRDAFLCVRDRFVARLAYKTVALRCCFFDGKHVK
jgi:hypothetical protein